MGHLTLQHGRNRVKSATTQIVEDERGVDETVDALRDFLAVLAAEAACADMGESFDVAVDAAESGRETEVARALVCEVAHSTSDDVGLTRVAVEHAPDPHGLIPEPPEDVLSATA